MCLRYYIVLILLHFNTYSAVSNNLNENILNIIKSSNGKKANLKNNPFDHKQSLSIKEFSDENKTLPRIFYITNDEIEKKYNQTRRQGRSRIEMNKAVPFQRSAYSVLTDETEDDENWKHRWQKHVMSMKEKAIIDYNNANAKGSPIVNMAALKPYGVTCGDPNQMDMPWGTCVAPPDCMPELRIFRGDRACTQSDFVCCALQKADIDLYEGLDASFSVMSGSTSSDQELSTESKKRLQYRIQKNKKKRAKTIRKREMKDTIFKLEMEIKRELKRAFRNNTRQRRYVSLLMKEHIRKLKTQVKSEERAAMSLHFAKLKEIDSTLLDKLKELGTLNRNFLWNNTFYKLIVEADHHEHWKDPVNLPDFSDLKGLSHPDGRRFETIPDHTEKVKKSKSKLFDEYSIEFGILRLN